MMDDGFRHLAFEDHLVRTTERDDEIWFVGKDVCAALELTNTAQALDRLDADEKDTHSVSTPGGAQMVLIVSEPGVYRLVFTSRKKSAERFQKWVAHDVLRPLRRAMRERVSALHIPLDEGVYVEQPRLLPKGGQNPGALSASPTIFTGDPSQVVSQKISLLNISLKVHGIDRTRQLWTQFGLPEAEPATLDFTVDSRDARACLDHLLRTKVEINVPLAEDVERVSLRDLIERGIAGDEDVRVDLSFYGIRIEEGEHENRFWIASHSELLRKTVFAGTRWEEGWRLAIKRLPGAAFTKVYRVNGHPSRGFSLPDHYLDA